MQMLLAVPAGLHFNAFIHHQLELNNPDNYKRFGTLLGINVALACISLPLALLIHNFPPTPPCASAEQPYPLPNLGVYASREIASRDCDSWSINSPTGQGSPRSTPLSARDVFSSHFAFQRARRGRGKRREGMFLDLPRILQQPSFWVLLLAFSLTIGAFSTFFLIMAELLDRSDPVRGYFKAPTMAISLAKLAGSFGSIAFIAGAFCLGTHVSLLSLAHYACCRHCSLMSGPQLQKEGPVLLHRLICLYCSIGCSTSSDLWAWPCAQGKGHVCCGRFPWRGRA
jgi:hypothetical protein